MLLQYNATTTQRHYDAPLLQHNATNDATKQYYCNTIAIQSYWKKPIWLTGHLVVVAVLRIMAK